MNAAAERLGDSLRNTEDTLMRNMLAATSAFINCTEGVNGDNPTEITFDDIGTVTQALTSADGMYFTRLVSGEDRFGSAPVKNAFFALASTRIQKDLNGVAGFIDSAQYPNPYTPLPSEYGSVGHLRFLVSTNGSVTPTSSNLGADVLNVFCLAQKAVACIEQDGYSAQFIYNGPELNGPLRLNSTTGWKTSMVQRLLNDAWAVSMRCTNAN